MQQHIITAATVGMKAGFNQRKQTCLRSGIPQVRAAARESFATYCRTFGPKVDGYLASMRSKPRNASVGVQVFADDARADELAELRQRIAEIEAEQSEPEAVAPKAKSTKVKVNVWHPWAIRKHGIPTKVGATFAYKGKRRTSTFQVTKVKRDGSVESVRVA